MSLHQSSVYAGTIAGGTLAGWMGQTLGWQSSFYLLGTLGTLLGFVLMLFLREPARGQSDGIEVLPPRGVSDGNVHTQRTNRPMMLVLMAVFVGANFVAAIVLTWMPSFLFRKFGMSLAAAGFSSTAYLQIASVVGVLGGGVLADRMATRHRGGRMMTQAIGLLAGVPFIFVTGWTTTVAILIAAMAGFGFFKGLYDANIWASLHDVVPTGRLATSVG